jgi:hypothetical protein
MDNQIMKMIDKSIVRNHPDIKKLMGCIDSVSFNDRIFWTYLFSVNKQDLIYKYFAAKKIWRYWFHANTNPEYLICRKRLVREFSENMLMKSI